MPEMYDVKVKVISQKDNCDAGHKVGDKWTISDKTPAGICLGAFNSLSANLRVLMFGGIFSWSDTPIRSRSPAPIPSIR
jgi:uncharacterized repeat protein (TIGR04076 family)